MWTNQNQADYDRTEAEAHNQAQIDNRNSIDNKQFNISDIICAIGYTSNQTEWRAFKRVTDYVENFAIGGLTDLKPDHLKEILESLEEEEQISVNWEAETFITNF